MTSLENMSIELDGIGHALSDNQLRVPHYQRSYAWEERHILDLFQDIATALSHRDKEYFLGSIVITQQPNRGMLEVVDGQQRLATTTILIAAIRDWFFRQGDLRRAEGITTKFLAPTDIRSQEVMPKLHLNYFDDEFFDKRILSLPDDADRHVPPSRPSHIRIAEAAALAAKHVQNLAGLTKQPKDYLFDWIDYIEQKVKIVWIEVPNQANAFTIFETLNDRGLVLAISDLLKNYLFGMARDRIEEAQERWSMMLGALDAVGGEELAVTFIRHLWSSKNGVTREKELYDKIKANITSPQEAIVFASELAQGAKLYAAILNPDHELWEKYGPTATEHVRTLNVLGLSQMRPLLLAVLNQFTTQEVRKSLQLFVSWSVRLLIQGGLGTGPLEQFYSQRSVDVRKGAITSAGDLMRAAQGTIPTDNQFRSTFATKSVSQTHLARYYLRVLEKRAQGEAEPSLVPNSNVDIVNLEHILPQHPSSAWGYITQEIAQEVFNRLGNLTILERRLNSAIGNAGFDAKKAEYGKSAFRLTTELCKCSTWDVDQIDQRQKELADLAVVAWPITV